MPTRRGLGNLRHGLLIVREPLDRQPRLSCVLGLLFPAIIGQRWPQQHGIRPEGRGEALWGTRHILPLHLGHEKPGVSFAPSRFHLGETFSHRRPVEDRAASIDPSHRRISFSGQPRNPSGLEVLHLEFELKQV